MNVIRILLTHLISQGHYSDPPLTKDGLERIFGE